jgi:hypothetical protein
VDTQAKRHHVVSKFYLRYFADEAEQVTTIVLPGERVFTQSVDNASVHNHFYTLIDHEGELTDSAERNFSLVESYAADAWRLVADGVWPLPAENREAMAAWIALQFLRGPRTRRSMSNLGSDMLQLEIMVGGRERLREALRELGQQDDDASVNREWISLFEDPLVVEPHANHHVTHIANMLPQVTALLLDRWWVLTPFQRKTLGTSDHPVHVMPNKDLQATGLGTGIANANEIHVPLTRRHSLGLALRSSLPPELATRHEDHRQPGVAAVALYSNSCTVHSAQQMLFHHPQDAPFKGLELPGPRTRELVSSGDPWRFMRDEDRQVLVDAGIQPPLDVS